MFREWGRMLRNIYVKRDKSIFKEIKLFSDIISDQIGFRLVGTFSTSATHGNFWDTP